MSRQFRFLPLLLLPFLIVSASKHIVAQSVPDAAQLEALSGEYTNPAEPDTPLSLYAKDGKLYVESERMVPAALTTVSATDFSIDAHTVFRFTKGAQEIGRAHV